MDHMKRFPFGHVTHPDWRIAVSLVVAQIRGRIAQGDYAQQPQLGIAYFSDHFAHDAALLLEALQDEFPLVTDWAGSVGAGVMAAHGEYRGEPALAVMLLDLPRDAYRIFSGIAPLKINAAGPWQQALVHADAALPDLQELLAELAARTTSKQLLGGVSLDTEAPVQLAWSQSQSPSHSGVLQGGLSGLVFGPGAGLLYASTQGCQLTSDRMRITALQGNVLLSLDGRPALDVLEEMMLVRVDAQPEQALRKIRHILVALESQDDAGQHHPGQFPPTARVCSLVGVDMNRRGIVLPESALSQKYLYFCQRNWTAARADLLRVCAELREAMSPAESTLGDPLAPEGTVERGIAGVIYISCTSRGGEYFGSNNGELELLHHVLGDIPLIGFFTPGQIAGQQLHRFSGSLLVFTKSD